MNESPPQGGPLLSLTPLMKKLAFMPQFGDWITGGVKTLTYRKYAKYSWAKEGDEVAIVIEDKTHQCVLSRALITQVETGCLRFDEIRPALALSWRYGPPLWHDDARRDGFKSIEQMLLMHAKMGNICVNTTSDPLLVRISFRVLNPEDAYEAWKNSHWKYQPPQLPIQ